MASVWDDIEKTTTEYQTLILAGSVLDILKFNMISITHHSTRIEGSTLTETETSLLLQEGITAKGKPLEQHLMVEDHFNALKTVLDLASKKQKLTPDLLCRIASAVMARTGTIVNAAGGSWDASKGEYRKAAVRSQHQYYVSYDKVPNLVEKLCSQINQRIETVKGTRQILELAFSAHFDLVQTHPWSDGNGRTSRLLMNFIEHFHGQPLTIVRSENKQEYIESILLSKDKKDLIHIINFLAKEHLEHLRDEIKRYHSQFKDQQRGEQTDKDQSKGYSLIF
jgi:Fic family protein